MRDSVPGMHDPYIPSDTTLLLNYFWGQEHRLLDTVHGISRSEDAELNENCFCVVLCCR
jgi:hypothetical protein